MHTHKTLNSRISHQTIEPFETFSFPTLSALGEIVQYIIDDLLINYLLIILAMAIIGNN